VQFQPFPLNAVAVKPSGRVSVTVTVFEVVVKVGLLTVIV